MAKNQVLSDLRLSIEIEGSNYKFDHITSVSESDELTRTLKISPQGFGSGIIEESGTTTAVSFTYTLNEVSQSLLSLMYSAFSEKKRVTVKEFSAAKGEKSGYAKTITNAIIKSSPWVGSLSDGSSEEVEITIEASRNNVKREELKS